ncbi:unnamed protein product [Thlaspi arvense]|uniref:Germin-like protein n=1 Tax=Thlaspi arvense TaxID=13288 RepID=A0AAU9S6B1_THLAR|nr:unnamed protein product [Thlaspi arvense]
MASFFLVLGLLATTCSIALAYDPDPLQDFCVADLNSTVRVNGYVCKDPNLVKDDDFYFSIFDKEANLSNPLGSGIYLVNASVMPGLNTLGLSFSRVDFKTRFLVGLVASSAENNRLFTQVLEEGDMFVYPKGLIHFQKNIGRGHAIGLAVFNSQNGGLNVIASAVFGSHPAIPEDILAKAFQVDDETIFRLQAPYI